MAPVSMKILVAGLNFTSQPDFSSAFTQSAADRNPVLDFIIRYWSVVLNWISTSAADFVQWLSQPHVYAVIIAWAITFTVITTIILTFGFGPAGIGAGTLAAGFQAWMYGGYTPAGGVFATLTSLGMLGLLAPVVALVTAFIASIVAAIVWALGVGR